MPTACRGNGVAGNAVCDKTHHLRIAQQAASHNDTYVVMLLSVFQDLIKPQWRAVIEELKRSGGLPASELARTTGASYMATKTYCEELKELGYVIRTRLPRAEVGRPEIFYSLSSKAEELFPQTDTLFTLELLENVRRMFGESAPEKLLFQHFQKLESEWKKELTQCESVKDRANKLSAIRAKCGHASELNHASDGSIQIIEHHNPLQMIFEKYPRAATLEQRMFDELLGTKVSREELEGGRESPPRITFRVI